MNNITEYSYTKFKKNIKKFVLLCIVLFILIGVSFVLAKSAFEGEDLILTYKVLIGISIGCLIFAPTIILIQLTKIKVALQKLPQNIDELFKNSTLHNDLEDFVFTKEGLVIFPVFAPIFVKYSDIERAFVFKFSHKFLIFKILTTYVINIKVNKKTYSCHIKKRTNKRKYTEKDFQELITEIGKRNPLIELE